LTQQ
jgi:hypothetical protein